jgi:DNA-binding CsgD family transcriptional regulator
MQLLERDHLLRTLDACVSDLSETGRLVCLTGEAGIGKTSVAHVIADRAAGKVRVLWGACEDLSTPAPLAPLQDFARDGTWDPRPAAAFANQMAFFEAAFAGLTSEPTLAILEDLHWADDATLDFVRFAGRRIKRAPLVLLITARDDTSESQALLRRVLAEVPPDNYERVVLPRLSKKTVEDVAGDHGMDGSAVYALTSGNPFLTMEVLKQHTDIPATVRDTLLWRADKLTPAARAALDAASIFPRRVERDVLEQMSVDHAAAVLSCVDGGLLLVDGEFYKFRHEIARRATEAALSDPVRRDLNQRALEVLKARPDTATARLVHHAIEAHDVSAISALGPLAATQAAEAGAHREAVKHLTAVLTHVDGWAPSRRAELQEQLGYELQLTGKVGAAIDAFQSALVLRQEGGDQLKAGDNLRWLSRLHYNVGKRSDGNDLGRRAIEVLEPLGRTYELAMAYANLALVAALQDDASTAIELATKTMALADELGRRDLLADAHSTLAVAHQWSDASASRMHFEEALKFALDCNRPELVARIYMNAGNCELNARANKAAKSLLETGVRYCDERDLATWAVYMKGLIAQLLVREGKWSEGEALALEALKASTNPVQRFPSSAALARLYIRRGDDADWLFDNLTFDNEPQRLLAYAPIAGERAWLLRSDVEVSIAMLTKAAAIAEKIGDVWAAGEIEYWRSKLEARNPVADGKVAKPFALLFAGDWRASAQAWQSLDAPYDRALALLRGEREACDEALSIFDDLGAPVTASVARRELRAQGVRGLRRGPRESTRSNSAGLTRREMDVLRLLDAGLSNNEIAARLNTATKTIDHHVSAVLSKLEATSRLDAVGRARKLQLLQD